MTDTEKLEAIAAATKEAKTVAARLSLRDIITRILKDERDRGDEGQPQGEI